jgi:hypothetical protein
MQAISEQTSSTSRPLNERWVERIFEVMGATYGRQRLGTMFDGQDPVMVKAVWGRALASLPADALIAAVHKLPEQAWTWPPTLPEFVAYVRDQIPHAAHVPALPVPDRTSSEIQLGAVQMAAIRESVAPKKDPAAWAYKVIERYRAGDSVVAHASYKIALEALHNLGREIPA